MKVGTDGVLLGAWANVSGATSALDIGTGSGLIALMLAQRNPSLTITGIEIDADAAEQASDNAAASRFSDRIDIRHTSLQDFSTERKFDLIVSNPPFYTEHTQNPDTRRNAARHTSSLPISILVSKASSMLADGGVFSLIVPSDIASEVIGEAGINGLFLSRRMEVKTTETKSARRSMLEFTRKPQPTDYSELHIKKASGAYSEEYTCLTQDFYL